ncbi:MAG TPA: hypothetical protein VGG03_20530 [Thermoanaerobaculia bacterium]|jgi:hypothetical protein
MRRPILAALAFVVLFTACWTGPPKRAAPPATTPKLLDLRVNPLMDLHYWVRKFGSESGELPAVEGLPAAVAATRQAGASLGDVGLWGILVASFTEATTAEELARVAAEVPETFTLRDGRAIPLRQNLTNLAAAYQPLEKTFLATVWPRHREVAERAAATLRRELIPKAPEVYADLSHHLGVPVPRAPIPVYLVAAAPFPGAFTMRSQEGPCSVVALEGEPDAQWVEIVVHETIHALDVQAGQESVLADLRSRLGKVPGASPQEVHDFVHTVMFAQAAGTVRRVLNPAHQDYGDVKGYYRRVGRAAELVVLAWRDYLDGKTTREAALDRIVEGFGKEKAAHRPPR